MLDATTRNRDRLEKNCLYLSSCEGRSNVGVRSLDHDLDGDLDLKPRLVGLRSLEKDLLLSSGNVPFSVQIKANMIWK